MAKPKTPRRSGRLATGKTEEKNEESDENEEESPEFECAFSRCKVNSDDNPDADFFEFPLDRPKMLAKWLTAIHRKSFKPSETSRICGDHFESDDFVEPKRKLRGDRGSIATDNDERVLKESAVPGNEAKSDKSDSEKSVKSESEKSSKSESEKSSKGESEKSNKSEPEKSNKNESEKSTKNESAKNVKSGSDRSIKGDSDKSVKPNQEKSSASGVKRKTRAKSNSTEGNEDNGSDSDDGQVKKKLRKGKRVSLTPGACAVSICENNMFDSQSSSVRFFRFPSSPKLAEAWKDKCGQEGINVLQARICSNHFTLNDFNTVTGPTANRNLKPNATPSLNISKETMTDHAGFPKRRAKTTKRPQSTKDEDKSEGEDKGKKEEKKQYSKAAGSDGKEKQQAAKEEGSKSVAANEKETKEKDQVGVEKMAGEEAEDEDEEDVEMPTPMILPDEIKSEPVSETDEPEVEEIKPPPTSFSKRKQSLTLRKDDDAPEIIPLLPNDDKLKKKTPIAVKDRRVVKDDSDWRPGKRPPPRRVTTPIKQKKPTPKKLETPANRRGSIRRVKRDSDSDADDPPPLDSIVSSKSSQPPPSPSPQTPSPARLEKMITLVDQRYAGKDGASVPQQYKLVVKVPESMSVEPGQVVTLKGVLTGDSGFKVATPDSTVPSVVAKVEEVSVGGVKAPVNKVRPSRLTDGPSTSKSPPKTASSLRGPSLASTAPSSVSVSFTNATGADQNTMVKELEKKYSFDELVQKYSEAVTEKAVVHKNLTELTEAQKGLEKSLASQERTIQRANEKIASLERRISSIDESLSKFLTPNQLKLSLNEARKVVWTAEEMLTAFTLCHLSKTTYAFLRNKLKFPLPKVEAVMAWEKLLLDEKTIKEDPTGDSSRDNQDRMEISDKTSQDQVVLGDKRNAAGQVLDEHRTAKKSRYISVKRQQEGAAEESKKQSSLGKLLGSALSSPLVTAATVASSTTNLTTASVMASHPSSVKEEPEVMSLDELNDTAEQVIDGEVTEMTEISGAEGSSVQYIEADAVGGHEMGDRSYVVVEEGEDGTLKVSCVGGEPNEDIINVVQQVLSSGDIVQEFTDETHPVPDTQVQPVIEPEQELTNEPTQSTGELNSTNEIIYETPENTSGTSFIQTDVGSTGAQTAEIGMDQQVFLTEGNLEVAQQPSQEQTQVSNAYCVVLDGVEYFMDEESAKAFMMANGSEQFILQEAPVTQIDRQVQPMLAGGAAKKKSRGPDHSYCQVKSGRSGILPANQQPPSTQNQ